jgi:tRNA pseudouridine synthase 10
MSQLDSIVKNICRAIEAKEYQFNSFMLGATLPSAVFEREDSIRSKLKVRGRENIKKQLLDKLRKKLEKITGKKVEYISPDVTIHIVIGNQDTDGTNSNDYNNTLQQTPCIKSSPILLSGRYVKTTRGLPQKKDTSKNRSGSGCALSGNMEESSFDSIEAIISRRVLELTKGDALKFSWLGGEDKDSLVLGKGRPFLVQVSDPKVRQLKTQLIIKENGVYAVVKQQSAQQQRSFQLPSHFTTKTKITIRSEGDLSSKSLPTLLNILENSEVSLKAKSRILKKKIYSLEVEQINQKTFIITIVSDGGLFIKQFVGGQEYCEPNISKIIGMKCECIAFDILEVNTQ